MEQTNDGLWEIGEWDVPTAICSTRHWPIDVIGEWNIAQINQSTVSRMVYELILD